MNSLRMSLLSVLSVISILSTGTEATNPTYEEILRMKLTEVTCVEGWDPKLCFCERLDSETVHEFIICQNISSPEELKNVLVEMAPPPNYRYFSLIKSPLLKSLPAGVFGNLKFEGIELTNNSIEVIEPGAIQGMADKLTDIILYDNKIKTMDFIVDLPLLKHVHISRESLCEEIPDNAFVNLNKQLSFIHIDECPLRSIGNNAFANTTGSILIRDNQGAITKIGDKVFSNAVGIIALSNVTDDAFSKDTFVGSAMEKLEVSGLTTLQQETFSPLLDNTRSDKEYIFKGPMSCDSSMDWLTGDKAAAFKIECKNGQSLQENINSRNN